MSDPNEQRIRAKAHEIWESEGRPHGRHQEHWDEAREIVALEDAGGPPVRPLAGAGDENGEPELMHENQGEFPTLTDQGGNPEGPELQAAADVADQRPLSTGDTGKTRGHAEHPVDPGGEEI